MYYRLLVMKVEDNPAFDPQKMAEWEKSRQHGWNYGEPYNEPREHSTRQLDVVLTEGEYETIKQEVVKVWK